jgi:transposase
MKNEQRQERLRGELATAERAGAGRPYPEALRVAAVEYRREREREGAALRDVAAELGVSAVSLERWSRRRPEREASFRAIELVGEPVRRGSQGVVHGPRGLRIEGLTVAEIAELVERLS